MAFEDVNKEEWISRLLVFMYEQLEKEGVTIKMLEFNFNETGEDTIAFLDDYDIEYDNLLEILNPCISRQFIKSLYLGDKGMVRLTEEGQGRAISVMNTGKAPVVGGDIHIGTLNASGPTQVGHQNTQNIEYVLNNLIEQINSCHGDEEEKQEIKSRLRKFLEHPVRHEAHVGV